MVARATLPESVLSLVRWAPASIVVKKGTLPDCLLKSLRLMNSIAVTARSTVFSLASRMELASTVAKKGK